MLLPPPIIVTWPWLLDLARRRRSTKQKRMRAFFMLAQRERERERERARTDQYRWCKYSAVIPPSSRSGRDRHMAQPATIIPWSSRVRACVRGMALLHTRTHTHTHTHTHIHSSFPPFLVCATKSAHAHTGWASNIPTSMRRGEGGDKEEGYAGIRFLLILSSYSTTACSLCLGKKKKNNAHINSTPRA